MFPTLQFKKLKLFTKLIKIEKSKEMKVRRLRGLGLEMGVGMSKVHEINPEYQGMLI